MSRLRSSAARLFQFTPDSPRGNNRRMEATLDRLEVSQNGHAETPLRLNLGAGNTTIPGFTNIDRKTGQEVYPLADVADDSVEEILASHVLEHFGHHKIRDILRHWYAKLKPGGKIRLAVPDFEEIAKLYLEGLPVNAQGYVMGGQTDENDFHHVIFDSESLTELMIETGLERIGRWVSDVPGCSSGMHSLNLQGFKPCGTLKECPGVYACRSVPRFGPLLHPRCCQRAFDELRIRGQEAASCFWAQKLSDMMEAALGHHDCKYVLTLDFDTVFCADDLRELYRLMEASLDLDAIFPLQSRRGCQEALFSIAGDKDGHIRTQMAEADLHRFVLPANTGHFGLTLFRAESLRNFPRPWMVPEPSPDGLWDGKHTDADIDFWKRFKRAGFKCALAPKVIVGHLEHVIAWPGRDLKPIFQREDDYTEAGIPAEVAR